jgi:hypothetical protein
MPLVDQNRTVLRSGYMATIDAFDDTLDHRREKIGTLFSGKGLMISNQLVTTPAMKTAGIDLAIQPLRIHPAFKSL